MSAERKRSILLIDDHKNLLATLGDYLEFAGFDVMRARSGEEALDHLQKREPDLIILDIAMPGMGGLGFLRRISLDEGRLKYPVLILTARALMEDFFEEIPVEGFLAKPCAEHEVLEKVRAVLARREAGREPAPRRILIVEDDPSDMARLRQAFEASPARYVVETVPTAAAVLAEAKVLQPDCIVINEVLGEASGAELCALLGASADTVGIPIVLYDATHAMDRERVHRYSVPGRKERFLSTAEPQVLLEAVAELLAPQPERVNGIVPV